MAAETDAAGTAATAPVEKPEWDARKVETKLHHIVKVAKATSKKAKQFELQKLVRKLKSAKDPESKAAMEKELEFLKDLEPQPLAVRALSTKLAKSKLIPKAQSADSERYPLAPWATAAGLDTESSHKDFPSLEPWQERVVHQLLSSKLLAEEVSSGVQALMGLVRPAQAPATTTKDVADDSSKAKRPAKKAKATLTTADDYESDDGMGNQARVPWDMDNLDAMVASGSDDDDDALSDDDLTDNDSMDGSVSDRSSNDQPPRLRKRVHVSDDEDEASPSFLPSLSTGFIPAADGDDWSDGEAEFADTGTVKGPPKSQRKNRRGQRERRAIWEKKYGRHANHLQLRKKEPKRKAAPPSYEQDHGWGAKANPAVAPPPRRELPHRRRDATPASAAPDPPRKPTKPASSAPAASNPGQLHPSWAAKQRAKEAQLTAKPTGQKIVFD